MKLELLHPAVTSAHSPGQLLEGFRYVRRTPRLLTPLLMMALIGALSYEFQVVPPVLAKRTFHGNADAYGYFTAAMGIGAVIGGLAVAGRRPKGMRGRVMALWAVAFLGTTPIGGPVVGYVAQHGSPRLGLALGGLAALTATALTAFPHLRQAWQLNRDRARAAAQSQWRTARW